MVLNVRDRWREVRRAPRPADDAQTVTSQPYQRVAAAFPSLVPRVADWLSPPTSERRPER